jgi:DNA-binding MarR family transcriptional regulator
MTSSRRATAAGDVDDLTDALLAASRALVAIASRSIAAVGEVTLPQFRTLVVLHSRGPQPAQQLAEELGVAPSTVTRMCNRLVDKALIERRVPDENRREVWLHITAAGAEIVAAVSRRRRRELRRIVSSMPGRERTALVRALEAFSRAAGEEPGVTWFLGWP